jgi:hypothetical protein
VKYRHLMYISSHSFPKGNCSQVNFAGSSLQLPHEKTVIRRREPNDRIVQLSQKQWRHHYPPTQPSRLSLASVPGFLNPCICTGSRDAEVRVYGYRATENPYLHVLQLFALTANTMLS